MRRVSPRTLIAGVLLIASGSSACARPAELEPVDRLLQRLDLAGRAAQLVMLAVAASTPAEADSALIRLDVVATPALGGVWIESGEMRAVARLGARLRSVPGVRRLVGADLDGGVGGIIDGATAFPSVGSMLGRVEPEQLREIGKRTAMEAAALGLDLGLFRAPATVGGIDFAGRNGEILASHLTAFLDGLSTHDIDAAVHIFWREPHDSTIAMWDLARLESFELPLLRAALGSANAVVAPGTVTLPTISGDSIPFLFSRVAINGLLRRDLAWDGLVIADLRPPVGDRSSSAVAPADAAVAAISSGSDLVIVDADPRDVVDALVAAVGDGTLPRERIDQAAHRVLTAKLGRSGTAAAAFPIDSLPPSLTDSSAAALAQAVADRLVLRFGGASAQPRGDLGAHSGADHDFLLVRPAGVGDAFAAELAAGAEVREVTIEPAIGSDALTELLASDTTGTSTVVFLDFPGTTEAPIHRLIGTLPDTLFAGRSPLRVSLRDYADRGLVEHPPDILGWGRSAPVQRAAARLLLGQSLDEGKQPSWLTRPVVALRPVDPPDVGMSLAGLAAADGVIEEAIQDSVFTAAAVAVGRRGGLVHLRGYGSLGDDEVEVDPRSSLFDLASLTKVVGTTTAAAILIDAGVMELDAPVTRYVPAFRDGDKTRVTIRHLLSHTSGLPSGLWLYGSATSREQAVQQVIGQPLRRPPGERVEYSDLGMILLAEAIERASDTTLDRLLAERVFTPLDMSTTMFLPPTALFGAAVPTALTTERPFPLRAVVHDGNAFRLGGVTGHAGLFSTARDLAVFAQMMLDGGSYGGVRIISDSTVNALRTKQPNADSRALGWDTPAARSSAGLYFSARSFGHTGYTGTSIWIDPDQDLFVVLLTNRTYTEASAEEIRDVRRAVHDAVARAITDVRVTRRPGAR